MPNVVRSCLQFRWWRPKCGLMNRCAQRSGRMSQAFPRDCGSVTIVAAAMARRPRFATAASNLDILLPIRTFPARSAPPLLQVSIVCITSYHARPPSLKHVLSHVTDDHTLNFSRASAPEHRDHVPEVISKYNNPQLLWRWLEPGWHDGSNGRAVPGAWDKGMMLPDPKGPGAPGEMYSRHQSLQVLVAPKAPLKHWIRGPEGNRCTEGRARADLRAQTRSAVDRKRPNPGAMQPDP